MSQKRQPEDGKEGNNPDEKRLCRPSLRSVMLEAVRLHDVQRILEPLVRKIVKEEIEVALRKHLTSFKQNCIRQVHSSTSRSLQLQFSNKLSLPVFTGTKLEAEECSAISLALIDTLSGQVVISGPESLAKVEIVALEGDFGGDEQENWTTEEFSNNIVKEREGKRSLLTGDAFLNLSDGTGVVGDLVFTDNSSWTRSRKFRLGARIIDGNSDGVTIKEAKTEPFMVKDHRGELYKKHYPPSLTDEVWRLEKIGKDGAFHKRLRSQNINTVKDFLTLLCIDTPRLRNILGTGMSAKMWEVTVDHARTCTLDNRMYAYYPLGAQKRLGVVFNIVGQVLGLLSEEKFVPIDELSDTEKADAHKLVQVAYERWEEVGPWEDGAVMGDFLLSPAVCFPSSSTGVESSYSNQLTSSQKSDDLGFNQSVFSSDVSSILSVGGPTRLNNYTLQGTSDMDLRYPQSSNMPDQVTHTLMSDMESMLHTFCGDDHLQYFDTEDAFRSQSLGLESQSDLQSAVSGFVVMSAQPAGAASVIAQTHWRILYSVLRWIFKIRRIVNSKKASKKRK